jgi:hypothetical protein
LLENGPRLFLGERFDLSITVLRRINQRRNIHTDDLPANCHLEAPTDLLMDHQDGLARQARFGNFDVVGVEVLRLQSVETMPADSCRRAAVVAAREPPLPDLPQQSS